MAGDFGSYNRFCNWCTCSIFHRSTYYTFVCRFIPILRSLILIPAGAAKMKLYTFVYLTAIGTAIWNTVLVWLGAFAGESWGSIVQYMNIYSVITLAVLGFLILILIFVFYKKRLKTTDGGPT